ncbi:MAG: hypothetical protein O2890_04515 [Cyanobacteria bacterium]|nr:hypothetical protein [Cyanobacteriota bacterium]MDA0865670.1 hypothetical protein [Cyanobacteriota bacterium]
MGIAWHHLGYPNGKGILLRETGLELPQGDSLIRPAERVIAFPGMPLTLLV